MAAEDMQEPIGASMDAGQPNQSWRPPAFDPSQFQQQQTAASPNRASDIDELEREIYQNETASGRNVHESSAGAIGPMQIMPSTFARYAQPGEDINNFGDNRNVGRRIIEDLYDRYGGDRDAVLVGYNAGEAHIGQPFDRLPAETQDYLQKANAQYARRGETQLASNVDFSDVPVLPPVRSAEPSAGPQQLGPYQTMSAAYAAKPSGDYILRQGDGGWNWTPKGQVPNDGTSPYYSAQSGDQFGATPAARIMAPGQPASPEAHGLGTWFANTNFGRGMASGAARLGDLLGLGISKVAPAITAAAKNAGYDTENDPLSQMLISKGAQALSAGARVPASVPQYGNPRAGAKPNLPYDAKSIGEDYDFASLGSDVVKDLGLKTDMDPNGIVPDLFFQAGQMVPWAVAGAPLLPALGATGAAEGIPFVGRFIQPFLSKAAESFAANPVKYAAGEAISGAGFGAGSGEAHEIYQGATGRTGDLGDTLAEIGGGGIWNAVRMPLIAAGEHAVMTSAKGLAQGIASGAASKGAKAAWNGAKDALGTDASGSLPPQAAQAATDAYLRNALVENLGAAQKHVDALGTVAPDEAGSYLAQRSETARDAVQAWLRGSRVEEKQLWAPVNLQMPRDFTRSTGLYQQLKADALSPENLRDPKSFPSELDSAFGGNAGLQSVDTLGRGQDLRSRIGNMLDQERGKPDGDAAKIGYLRQLQDSLKGDLQNGAEGANPAEIDAYRNAMAFSASRAQLANSPEMTQFMSRRVPDEAALDKMLKQGPAGVAAGNFLTQIAQDRYGSKGILGATEDAIRQKYANAVAPYGYVSLSAHNAFMTRYGGLLDQFPDVKKQLADAGTAEQTVNSMAGFGTPRGYGPTIADQAAREDASDLYLQAPTKTVVDHLEGIRNPAAATAAALDDVARDPTGRASIGLQHEIALRATQDPTYLTKHPEMLAAVDKVNPGFVARAEAFQNPRTLQGLTKTGTDFFASIIGSHIGRMMPGAEHSGLVATGRGAQAMRQATSDVVNRMMKMTPEDRATQIVAAQQKFAQATAGMTDQERAALVTNPEAAEAARDLVFGLGKTPADHAHDVLQVYRVAPMWAASYGIADPRMETGTGQPGSGTNPGGPPSMRGGPGPEPWWQQLTYPQHGPLGTPSSSE